MENQNQESVPGQQTINIQIPSADSIASRRSLIPVMFGVVIILFFFNFFTVSCGGQKVGSVTGINLVTGTELKDHDLFSGGETQGGKIPANMWAIIAFGAAIFGLGAFLIKEKNESVIGTLAGTIGFGSLIILQFVIKNSVDKKAAGSPIQTDFEFAYWGALIAMGISGFISYLRMQKTNKVIFNIVPASTPTISNTENVTQTQNHIKDFQDTSKFDLEEWFNKNKKMVIGVLASSIILFGVYYFFIKYNPVKDGKNGSVTFCDCSTKYNEAIIKVNEEFINTFNTYGFKKRQEARSKLLVLQNSANSEYSICANSAQQKYNKLRNRYLNDKEKLGKFDLAYTQSTACNQASQNKLSTLYVEIENKITSIKDPLPDIDKIKSDLLGHKILTWNFEALSEFNQANILNITQGSNIIEFHVKLHLLGFRNPETDIHDAEILVTYNQSNNGWNFNDVKPIYYTQNYIGLVNQWTAINFNNLPHVNYSIIHNEQKFWIQDGSYGTKYKGGPGGDQYHLSSNEIYIMSREEFPITLTFKFSPNN